MSSHDDLSPKRRRTDRLGTQPWRDAPCRRGDLGRVLARAERSLLSTSVESFEGPPPEVQREMVAAQRAWRSLAAQGREVRFGTRADGRVSIELTDRSGRAVDVGPVALFRLLNLAR